MDDLSALVERVRQLASSGARAEAGDALEELAVYGSTECASPDDGATVLVTAATLAADLGMRRKRALFLWRAATLARHDPARSLALLTALVPLSDSGAVQPLAAWPVLQRGVLWEALTRATRCADAPKAWDLAARLLKHHCAALSPTMQAALVRALQAASALFPPEESGGRDAPPPGVELVAVKPLPRHRRPLPADSSAASAATASVFVFSPFERTRAAAVEKQQREEAVVEWVVGEPCAITIALSNPTGVTLRLDGLALVTSHQEGWEPQGGGDVPGGGSIALPPGCTGLKVTLHGMPTRPGELTFTGVAIDAFGGVWHAPWQDSRKGGAQKNTRAATAVALPPLPLLLPRLDYGGLDTPAAGGPSPATLARTPSGGGLPRMRRNSSSTAMDDLQHSEAGAMHTPPVSPMRNTPTSVPRRLSSSSGTPASAAKGSGLRQTPATAMSSRLRRSRSALFGSTTSLATLGGHDTSAPWMEEAHRLPPFTVTAYQGQATPLCLHLHNCGPVSAARVQISVAGMLQTPQFGSAGSADAACIEVDTDALSAALPLPPGGQVAVPLVWHGRSRGSRNADVATEVQQYTLTVATRYWGERPLVSPTSSPGGDTSEETAAWKPHARECRAELACSLLPGVRLRACALLPVTGAGGGASVLQLDVRNEAAVSMALRHCDVAEGSACGARLLRACVDAAPPSDWHTVPPGGDARLLVASHVMALMWRCEADGTVGWVPGVAQAVALLAPQPCGVSPSANMRPMLRCTGPGVVGSTWSSSCDDDGGSCGSVRLGSSCTLHMSISGAPQTPEPYSLRLSLRIHAADGTCVCPGGAGSEDERRRGIRLAWTGTPTATWHGPLAGPPPEHAVQLLFLARGVYTLLVHAQQLGQQGQTRGEAWEQAHLVVVQPDE